MGMRLVRAASVDGRPGPFMHAPEEQPEASFPNGGEIPTDAPKEVSIEAANPVRSRSNSVTAETPTTDVAAESARQSV